MNSQEELDRKVHQAIVTNNLRGTIGELKSEVLSIIEAEASRRERAAEERVLDELKHDFSRYTWGPYAPAEIIATKRQSLK
jgi:hypothetical protein